MNNCYLKVLTASLQRFKALKSFLLLCFLALSFSLTVKPAFAELVLEITGNNGIADTSPLTATHTAQHTITNAGVTTTGNTLNFDGSSYLAIPDSPDFAFEGGDFTMETWVKFDSFSGHFSLFSFWDSNSHYFHLYRHSANGYIYAESKRNGSDSVYKNWNPNFTLNTWHHVALVRAGSVMKLFIDGTLLTPVSTYTEVGTNPLPDISNNFNIGWNDHTSYPDYFIGSLDDVRVYKGEALYTANFTPPSHTAALTSIASSPASHNFTAANEQQQLTVTATYNNASTMDVTSIATYNSSDTAVAAVDVSGLITSVAPGTTTITASYTESGVTQTSATTVTLPSPVVLNSLSILPTTTLLTSVGQTLQIAATAGYSDSTSANVTATSNYASSNTSVATVSVGGLVTAVADGSATVAVSYIEGGITKTGTVTVTVNTAPVVTSLTLTPVSASFSAAGQTAQISVTANYNNGTSPNVTATASYSSSNTSAVQVSSVGLISPVGTGSATVSVSFGGVTAVLPVTSSIVNSTGNVSVSSNILEVVDGNVGIGTLNPTERLTVNGSIELLTGGIKFSDGTVLTTATGKPYSLWSVDGLIANAVYVDANGKVGIGTLTPQSELAVNGTITAKEMRVSVLGWPDYVFSNDYQLTPLSELEEHLKTNRHLPGIPSAQQVEQEGASVGEMQKKLLEKIEELTLYVIELKKENDSLNKRLSSVEQQGVTAR